MDNKINEKYQKQINELFPGQKTIISLIYLEKYLKQHQFVQKITEGVIDNISKNSYMIWLEKQDHKNINTLLKIQLLGQVYKKYKANLGQLDKIIDETNNHLKKIEKSSIDVEVFKKALAQQKTQHIYLTYSSILKSKDIIQPKPQQKMLPNDNKQKQQTKTNVQQSEKMQKQNHNKLTNSQKQQNNQKISSTKQVNKKGQQNINISTQEIPIQQVNFKQIFKKFYDKQEIKQKELDKIGQKIKQKCYISLLKQYKLSLPKVINQQAQQFSIQKFERWFSDKKATNQKTNNTNNPQQSNQQPPNKQKKQLQHKQLPKQPQQPKIIQQQNKKQHINKFQAFLSKYFKAVQNKQKKDESYFNNFYVDLKHVTVGAASQNLLNFQINILCGQKQITQSITEFESKKLLNEIGQKQHILIQIFTKHSEQLEQKIENLIKQGKINIPGLQIKTFTQKQKIYLSLHLENDKNNTIFINRIHQILTENKQQNHCKMQIKAKLCIQNQNKKLQQRKLIKYLISGFQLTYKMQGSPSIIKKFRANICQQNKQSIFYSLLSLSKSSQFKLKWKKIEDLNNLLTKLGILQMTKATPTIKQVVNQITNDLFSIQNNPSFSIQNILSLILLPFQTNKIILTRLNQKCLISFELNQSNKNVANLIVK